MAMSDGRLSRRPRARPGGARRRRAAGSGRVRAPGPPGFARRGLVGGGVVPGAMAGPPLGDLAGAPLEDGEDIPGPGAPLALAAARAGGEGARGAQRGGGPGRGASWGRRSARPGRIGRPGGGRARAGRGRFASTPSPRARAGGDHASRIQDGHCTQPPRAGRRRQREPDEVPDLVYAGRGAGARDGLAAGRRPAARAPEAPARRGRPASRLRQRAPRPRGEGRRPGGATAARSPRRPARPRGGVAAPTAARREARETLPHDTAPPLPPRVLLPAPRARPCRVAQTRRATPNQAAPIRPRPRHPGATNRRRQRRPGRIPPDPHHHGPAQTAGQRPGPPCAHSDRPQTIMPTSVPGD